MKKSILRQFIVDFVSCLVFASLFYIAIVQFVFKEPRLHYFHWTLVVAFLYALVRLLIDNSGKFRHWHR